MIELYALHFFFHIVGEIDSVRFYGRTLTVTGSPLHTNRGVFRIIYPFSCVDFKF